MCLNKLCITHFLIQKNNLGWVKDREAINYPSHLTYKYFTPKEREDQTHGGIKIIILNRYSYFYKKTLGRPKKSIFKEN